MKSVALNAFPRLLGRRPGAKRLRAAGRIPAVIYGRQIQPQKLEVNAKEMETLIHHSVSENLLVDLEVKDDARPKRLALGFFGAQLAANALWSWLFFAWHRGALASGEVVLLLVLIIATVVAFWRTSRPAALLLAPYLLWVGFASMLTWAVWRGNPGLL